MQDRPSCFRPAMLRGMLAAVLCAGWMSAAGTAGPADSFFGQLGRPDPDSVLETGQIAGQKSIGGTLQVVVGDGGTVLYNEGAGWKSLPDPGGYPSGEWVYRVDALSLDNLWVCGDNGVRFFDGTGWGPPELPGNPFFDIMVRPDGVVVCSLLGKVYRRAGSGWEEIGDFGGVNLRGVWGVSADDFWICGANGFIRRYRNGEWEIVVVPTTQWLHAIWGAPGVGPFFVGDSGTLLEYRAGAIHQINTGTTQSMLGIDGTSSRNIWIGGSNGRVWFYDGTEALEEHHPGGTSNFYWAVNTLPSGLVTVAGNNGSIQHYDGANWTGTTISGSPFLVGMVSLPSQDNAGWWDGFARAPRGLGLMLVSGSGAALNLVTGPGGVYALGSFSGAGAQELENFASFDGDSWHPLPHLIPPFEGHHVDVFQNDVVAVGWYEDVLGVYRWNGSSLQQMGNLPAGVTDIRVLKSLSVGGEERLYIAGYLRHPGDSDLGAVFGWHPDTQDWRLVGQGLPLRYYYGLAEHGGDLFVGGNQDFSAPYGGIVMRLASGNPADTWQQVLASPNFAVISLLNHQGQLYAGCGLGAGIDALRLYVPGGDPEWVGQGAVLPPGHHYIFGIISWGDRIAMVGVFPSLASVPTSNVALWEGGAIQPLGSGSNGGLMAAAVLDDDLYIGGPFTSAGGRESWGIARWRDLELPGDLIPSADVVPPDVIIPGEPAVFTAGVESYQTIRSVTLSYRVFDQDGFKHRVMEQPAGKSNGFFQTTVPAIDASLHGLQYFVTVQTDQATVTVPPNAGVAAGYVGAAVSRTQTFNPVARRYELIGIPFVPTASTSDIFAGGLGSYDPAQWRLERWNPAAERYRSFNQFQQEDAVAPGRGYYLIQRSPSDLTITGATTSTVNGTSITLAPGWNMIATPYLFSIPWNQVIRPAGVEDVLYGRIDDEYLEYTGASAMQPWWGYFLYLDGDDDAVITVPAQLTTKEHEGIAGKDDGSTDPAGLAGCDWLVTITPTQGERRDLVKTVGALTPEADGPGNLRQPPPLEHDLSVWLELERDDRVHQLRRELRTLDGGAVWELVVRPAAGEDAPVSLVFGGLDNVPDDLDVALASPRGVVDLRQAGGLWQGAAAGETRLRLVIGDPQLIEQAAGTLPMPYALMPAYPNPSNPMTTVAFTLPREGRVRIDMYDVAGRRVRTLVDEVRGPGRHAIEWDGTDDRGRGLSSGVYLLRLRAADFSQTRKLTLVR